MLEQVSETYLMMESFVCELAHKDILNEILLTKCHSDNKSLIDSIFFKKRVTEKNIEN